MTSDVFYDPHPDGVARWGRRGYLCVEMETAAVYLLAMRERAKGRPVRAGSILTVSDIIVDPSVAQEARDRRQRDVVPAARGRGHPARGPHDRRRDGGGGGARPGLMSGSGAGPASAPAQRDNGRVSDASARPEGQAARDDASPRDDSSAVRVEPRGARPLTVPTGSRRPDGGSGSQTPAPVPPLRAPTRFSWLGIALLGGAAVIAFVVTVGIFLPALGELGGHRAGPGEPAPRS